MVVKGFVILPILLALLIVTFFVIMVIFVQSDTQMESVLGDYDQTEQTVNDPEDQLYLLK